MLYEAVPPSVAALLRDIHHWPLPLHTYLAGGTAIALYLDHRVSIDIDLFTEEAFYPGPVVSFIGQNHAIEVINVSERDTLNALVDSIKLSLFHYPYPLIKPMIANDAYNIYLASPEDIAAMKVVAIAQRGIAKDFVDLKALISTYGISLDDLMEMVQKKYRVSEEYRYQIKRSLVYFDDAVNNLIEITMIENGERVRLNQKEWGRVEDFFKRLVLG